MVRGTRSFSGFDSAAATRARVLSSRFFLSPLSRHVRPRLALRAPILDSASGVNGDKFVLVVLLFFAVIGFRGLLSRAEYGEEK